MMGWMCWCISVYRCSMGIVSVDRVVVLKDVVIDTSVHRTG